jgi:hypothetical protein
VAHLVMAEWRRGNHLGCSTSSASSTFLKSPAGRSSLIISPQRGVLPSCRGAEPFATAAGCGPGAAVVGHAARRGGARGRAMGQGGPGGEADLGFGSHTPQIAGLISSGPSFPHHRDGDPFPYSHIQECPYPDSAGSLAMPRVSGFQMAGTSRLMLGHPDQAARHLLLKVRSPPGPTVRISIS